MTNFDILTTFLNTYLNSIQFGYSAIQPSVNFLLSGLITITIAMTALLTWTFGDWEGMIRGLIQKILLIGFILLVVQNWQHFTDIVGEGLAQLGLKAGGTSMSASSFLNNPTSIVVTGFLLCKQICAQADAVPGGTLGLANLPDKFIYGLAAVGVFLSFLIIALQVLVTFIEFKIINLAALVFVPFQIWPKTEFLSQRSFGFMFSSGIKLFVLALIVSIGLTFTVRLTVSTTPDLQNALAILSGSVMLMTLAIAVPSLAQSLIAGGPQLSAGNAAMGAAAMGAVVGGAGVYSASALGQIGRGGGAVTDRAVKNVGQSGVEQMKRAATAGGAEANNNSLSQMAKASNTTGGTAPPNDNPPSGNP
jgi:type IV secretion system protein TrbL